MKLKPVVASLVMMGLMTPAFAKSTLASQQAVIDQNSVISPTCSEGWFNRINVGGVGSVVGIAGNHDPAGSYTHINNGADLYVNNFNLLVNANLSNWSKATLNLAYLGAPIPWNNMHRGGDDQYGQYSYRSIKHTIVADEAYVTISKLNEYPFYLKVGKTYVPFGYYTDPQTPYQIMSPAQMLAQTNAVAGVLGVVTDFGIYASAFAFKGETYPVGSEAGTIRNYGGEIGYYDNLEALHVPNAHMNISLGYIHNLWDSNVFSPNPEPQWGWSERQGSGAGSGSSVKVGHPVTMFSGKEYAIDPVGGVSLHGDFAYRAFAMTANFVSAIKKMVPDTYSIKSDSSRFWGADLNATYAFKTLERESHLGAGIQWSGNGSWFGDNKSGSITDWCRIIPKWRLLGEYKINLFKNTDLGLVVAHGKSYDFVTGATPGSDKEPQNSRNSTVGLARLMVQF